MLQGCTRKKVDSPQTKPDSLSAHAGNATPTASRARWSEQDTGFYHCLCVLCSSVSTVHTLLTQTGRNTTNTHVLAQSPGQYTPAHQAYDPHWVPTHANQSLTLACRVNTTLTIPSASPTKGELCRGRGRGRAYLPTSQLLHVPAPAGADRAGESVESLSGRRCSHG